MRLDLRTTGNTPLHLEGLWDRGQPGRGKWDLSVCTEAPSSHFRCPSLHKTCTVREDLLPAPDTNYDLSPSLSPEGTGPVARHGAQGLT